MATRAIRDLGMYVVGLAACAGSGRPLLEVPATPPPPDSSALLTRVILIGDAGAPGPDDPVLRAMERDAARDPDRTLVIFLGDNIYPRGLPDVGDPTRRLAEEKLIRQLAPVARAGVRAIMVPGNHDWDRQGPGGYAAVRRQEAFVTDHFPMVEYLPGGGCPGPVARDVAGLRILALDTQWWLHSGPKPADSLAGCAAWREEDVAQRVAALGGEADRPVLVVAHHPLASGGEHGGHFPWQDHLFPLRAVGSWGWIPLPGAGSLYPRARAAGISNQDLSGRRYRTLIRTMAAALRGRTPAIWAAGHEHNLQVMRGTIARHLLVSGSGYFGHGSYVTASDSTAYASAGSGYLLLDVRASGRLRLTVREVSANGATHSTYISDLD